MNKRAFVLGAVMVLLVNFVAVALRSFAEASFIAAYGKPALPWLLVLSAGGFAIATFAYDAITRVAKTSVVDPVLLVLLLFAAVASPTLVELAPPGVVVITVFATSQVAGLALWNRVAASVAGRDARRMLPRAGAAVTMGGVIAGLGAGALIPRLGAPAIPYLAAGVTIVVFVLCLVQAKALAAGGAPGAAVPAGMVEKLNPTQRRLLGALIVVALVEGVVTTVIDLQFLGALRAEYTGDKLVAALALFYGGTNTVLLLLQATLVPLILTTRSLPIIAAIHPVLVMIGYIVFAIAPGLPTIAGARTADQVLRLATTRTSQEIELSAFPPTPRARWKVLLRGALWPAGAAGAALVLIVIGPQAQSTLAIAAIAFAIAWFAAVQVAARRFQTALAAPLGIKATKRDDPTRIDLETLERWTEVAGDDDPKVAALARAALARAKVDATDLANHLTHEKAALRAALFEQLGTTPSPALKNELRAAVAIEDDDRALALGIKALALLGDDSGIAVAKSRAMLATEVSDAVRTTELALHGTGDAKTELVGLCARDPRWAIALARAKLVDDATLTTILVEAAGRSRAGALIVIAHVGSDVAFGVLGAALVAGEPEATTAIASLDAVGAAHAATKIDAVPAIGRAIAARSLAGAPDALPLIAALLADRDSEVAHAALRTALAIASGGGRLPQQPVARALEDALAALRSHLDARDASDAWTACAKHELELATRRCVARLLWASAVEAAAGGRDPAPLAATARVLVGGRSDADRKRALDVVQELQSGRTEILSVIERWIRPADPSQGDASRLKIYDPWLAQLGAGQSPVDEATLTLLRKPALLSNIAGPALADLAQRAKRQRAHGVIFREGDPGEEMLVVAKGAVVARRASVVGNAVAVERRIEPGGVVGELAVLTRAPRAATVSAEGDDVEVLLIDRATFAVAARRAPELVLGLSATLAGWIAPNRPDLL